MPRKPKATKKRKRIIKEKDVKALDVFNHDFEQPLTGQALRFVKEYVFSDDLDATAAAIRAGYSKNTASNAASKLKKDPRVIALINEDMQNLFQDIELRKKFLLKRLFDIITADITNYVNIENVTLETSRGKEYKITNLSLKDIFKLPPSQRQLVESISQGKEGIKIKLVDKIAAATLLGKHFQLFKDEDEDGKGDTYTQVNIYLPDNGRDSNK